MPGAIGALRLNWDIDARLGSHKSANEPSGLLVPVNMRTDGLSPNGPIQRLPGLERRFHINRGVGYYDAHRILSQF
jgi:hypothetical protein